MEVVESNGRESAQSQEAAVDQAHNGDDTETYAFRLFSTPSQHTKHRSRDVQASSATNEPIDDASQPEFAPATRSIVQQVCLKSPTSGADNHASSDVQGRAQKRPLSYYLAPVPSDTQRSEYAAVALSGELVQKLAKRPCPGLRLPWRVIILPPSSMNPSADAGPVGSASATAGLERHKRTRLGKTSRLKLRRKMQALQARRDVKIARDKEAARVAQAKEEKIRERNKRRNREKQLKKRQRAREQKTSVAQESAEVAVPDEKSKNIN